MSTKAPRPRKPRQKDEMKHEIVVQVHKSSKKDLSADKENIKKSEQNEDSSESNRTFIIEDKNDNYGPKTPSRDVSVDEESQINSKIMNLIETEMKMQVNKHSHFTDSRPQSLSFYEDEKVPEELSGNLELLSPEERKHYKRRKEYADLDLMERNVYNSMQDVLSRENDEIILSSSVKKSKSRKKKHSGDSEMGLGDSREMMIPKEKRKSKKKKRDYSPLSSNSSKKKHRKRDDDYEPKTDITLALEELQDDVFENGPEDFARPERTKKSPRKSDKLYVQRKNKFELATRADMAARNMAVSGTLEDGLEKRVLITHPLKLAIDIQRLWLLFSLICHGFLGGLTVAHNFYLHCNRWLTNLEAIQTYANYSDLYVCMFYFLCCICIISVFDRYDLSHLNAAHIRDLYKSRKRSVVILIYLACLIAHVLAAPTDYKFGLKSFDSYNESTIEFSPGELRYWANLSFWRDIFGTFGWIIIAFTPKEDLFYIHLKTMEKYIVES